MRDQALRLYHSQAVEVWENFCRLHRDLFELTCDEYQTLLSGEVEALETLVTRKEAVMADINAWDAARTSLIQDIDRAQIATYPISNIKDLLDLLREPESQMAIPALTNLNALLIDIITQTHEQNKRNQVFLNRALLSLRDLREGFSGKRQYTTYGADGLSRAPGR
jgi:flagellar biosynthesis/type III secretory pathway chaperone